VNNSCNIHNDNQLLFNNLDILIIAAGKPTTHRRGDRKMVTKSIELDVVISASESDLEYKKKIIELERGPAIVSQILKHGLVGTPEKIGERLQQYTNAGVACIPGST
jgi:hypothetical protein